MLEQNIHRMMMTILGIVSLGMIVGGLYVAGMSMNNNARDDLSMYEQTRQTISKKNQLRTTKY